MKLTVEEFLDWAPKYAQFSVYRGDSGNTFVVLKGRDSWGENAEGFAFGKTISEALEKIFKGEVNKIE